MKLWSWKMLWKAPQKACKSAWLDGLTPEQQATLTANLRRMLDPERPSTRNPGRQVTLQATLRVTLQATGQANRAMDRVIDRPQKTAASLH